MRKTRLYLKNPKAERSLIGYEIRESETKIRISTGISIPVSGWDDKSKSIKRDCPSSAFLSQKLMSFTAIAAKQVLIADAMELSMEKLKENILIALGREVVKDEKTEVLHFYKWWAQHSFGEHVARIDNLHHCRIFEEFLKEKNKTNLSFEQVDYNFYIEFRIYLEKVKGYKPNTVATHLRDLKTVMGEARIRNLHTSDAYKVIKCKFANVDTIYLSVDEINALYKHKLEGVEEMVRDLFVLGCHTAMRFQDYSTLSIAHIDNNRITIKTKKTGETVIIPAHPRVIEILNKWEGKAPKISHGHLNKTIKEICKDMGCFNQKMPIKDGRDIKYVEKYNLISAHTARRSGATNMYLAGIPAQSIMKITGHTTEQSFMKYLRVSKEENANLLANNPFFRE